MFINVTFISLIVVYVQYISQILVRHILGLCSGCRDNPSAMQVHMQLQSVSDSEICISLIV